MRRRKETLLPIELAIIDAGIGLRSEGTGEFHGFLIAKRIGDEARARRLTSHGTLYKALAHLEKTGLVESRWEDPVKAAREARPRRRYYRITAAGKAAAIAAATASKPIEVPSDDGLDLA